MKKNLEKIDLFNFKLENGLVKSHIPLTYQIFGQPIGKAPVIIVNHALTGNSNVAGTSGWWNDLIGEEKTIDTNYYTIISFNIPGNGYDAVLEHLILDYKHFTIRDIAKLFWEGLFSLEISKVFAIIGGSLGGAIAWEMAVLQPNKLQHLIPIATDWKATDWVIANVLIQDQILNNSDDAVADARLHAMLLYRTPQSINQRFNRVQDDATNIFQIENWLLNHGNKLKNRFHLSAYKLMNHLLRTNDITRNRTNFLEVASSIQASIHLVTVDTDYFFIADENRKDYQALKEVKSNVYLHEIISIHGHDAFLMEYNQLAQLLAPIFNKQKQQYYVNA